MNQFQVENYIPNLSTDCVIFGYEKNELKVLLAKFKFGDSIWTLPGGYVKWTESIEIAASRTLKERTSLEYIYLEQFRVFGSENRIVGSPFRDLMIEEFSKYLSQSDIAWRTSRFVCIGFYALVDINKVNPQNGEFDEYLEWRSINNIPEMVYDHNEILSFALEELRQNLDRKLIAFNLLPETFTIQELHALYEAVYAKKIVISNFQKRILDLNVLERLEKKFTGAQHKAPYLYRFKRQ
jgi:ADP-ribose pyrophosphatase YjhB (NUDIX family)